MGGSRHRIGDLGRRPLTVLVTGAMLVATAIAGVYVLVPAEGGNILAEAAGETITEEAFRQEYRQYLLTSGVPDRPALRLAFLSDMIGARLQITEAVQEGIRRTSGYQDRQEVVARKLLVDAFVQRTVLDTLRVAETNVREMFVRAQSEVTARHLIARTKAEADTLRARLGRGETFKFLAQEVFKDSVLKANGGLLPAFTFDEMDAAFEDAAFSLPLGMVSDPDEMDAAFEDAAFSLPLGMVSDPVRTAQGFSIIRVEDRFTKHSSLSRSMSRNVRTSRRMCLCASAPMPGGHWFSRLSRRARWCCSSPVPKLC